MEKYFIGVRSKVLADTNNSKYILFLLIIGMSLSILACKSLVGIRYTCIVGTGNVIRFFHEDLRNIIRRVNNDLNK